MLSDLLLALASLLVGALIFTGQVPPKQAISNISAWWLKPFGIRIASLEDPDADRVIRNIAWLAVPGLLIWGGVQYLDIQNMRDGPKALLVVGALCLISGVGWHIWSSPRTAFAAASNRSEATAFKPEVPRGPAGKECFADGVKELRGLLAQMRQVVPIVSIGSSDFTKIDQYKARLQTSREIHAKLTGPGEGPFFSSRPECKASLLRLFPNETQATWERFHSALHFYLNGLQIRYDSPPNIAPMADTNLGPLQADFLTAANNLNALLEEITKRLRIVDEAMQ
jgi:hypothetical protein